MMFARKPACLGCGDTGVKLSRKHMCNTCTWAISQRMNMEARSLENAIKGDEIKRLNDQLEAEKLAHQILVEENVLLRSDLIKAYRKIRTLTLVDRK